MQAGFLFEDSRISICFILFIMMFSPVVQVAIRYNGFEKRFMVHSI